MLFQPWQSAHVRAIVGAMYARAVYCQPCRSAVRVQVCVVAAMPLTPHERAIVATMHVAGLS
jgi:hypothetical protein